MDIVDGPSGELLVNHGASALLVAGSLSSSSFELSATVLIVAILRVDVFQVFAKRAFEHISTPVFLALDGEPQFATNRARECLLFKKTVSLLSVCV